MIGQCAKICPSDWRARRSKASERAGGVDAAAATAVVVGGGEQVRKFKCAEFVRHSGSTTVSLLSRLGEKTLLAKTNPNS